MVGGEIDHVEPQGVAPEREDRLGDAEDGIGAGLGCPNLVFDDRTFVIGDRDVGSLLEACRGSVVARVDRFDRVVRSVVRRVDDRRGRVCRSSTAERPVPTLAQRHGLVGGPAVGAQASDVRQSPDLRGVVRQPLRLESRIVGACGTEDGVVRGARFRIAEQVRPEQAERPVARYGKDLGRRLDEARWKKRDARLLRLQPRRDLSGRHAGLARSERRFDDVDAARHQQLASVRERYQLVDGDDRLEVRDAGDDRQRNLDLGTTGVGVGDSGLVALGSVESGGRRRGGCDGVAG